MWLRVGIDGAGKKIRGYGAVCLHRPIDGTTWSRYTRRRIITSFIPLLHLTLETSLMAAKRRASSWMPLLSEAMLRRHGRGEPAGGAVACSSRRPLKSRQDVVGMYADLPLRQTFLCFFLWHARESLDVICSQLGYFC